MNFNRPQNPLDQKNFILAVALSMAIIFGWQWFFVAPKMQLAEQQAKAQQAQTSTATNTAATGTAPSSAAAGAVIPRDKALEASQRVPIDTPDIDGSINLKGGALDDLKLKNFREKVSPASPEIVLLSPSGTKNAYFVEHYLVPAAGSTTKVPTPETVWSADANAKLGPGQPVVLSWDNGEGVIFRRHISVDDKFVFAIKQEIENKSSGALALTPFARVQRQDTPAIEGWYVFFEGMLGVHNEVLTEVNYAAVAEPDGTLKVDSKGGWHGFTDKYWSTVLIPDVNSSVSNIYKYAKENGRDVYQAEYQAATPILIAPGATGTYQDHVFSGAKQVRLIESVGTKLGIDQFDRMIDWGWFPFLTKPMFWLLDTLKSIVGNFGVAILIATVLVKLLLFPLANKSYASMSKMKKLQPEMERLKAQYPDDKVKMQQELMDLYKKEKVNPVSGCLPIFIQIPVFFALYKVILTSIELRHAPFFGWIQDLSAPDPTSIFNLFGLLPYNVPTALLIGVWPLLMGITMWVQMRLNPTPADPIQASLFNWMPIIFTFTLGGFPAGLVIYWAWSNFLSILQQSYIMKRNGTDVDILGNIRESLPFLKKKTPA